VREFTEFPALLAAAMRPFVEDLGETTQPKNQHYLYFQGDLDHIFQNLFILFLCVPETRFSRKKKKYKNGGVK
jgi:hypothetical protein